MSASALKAAMDSRPGDVPSRRDSLDASTSSMTLAQSFTWVPDEEVNECPLCARKFSLFVPRHHCRACSRIICGNCCGNQIFLPQEGKKGKVCDPCHELNSVDKNSELTDRLAISREVEAALKTHLKETHQQAEWFKGFLLQVTSEANAPGTQSPRIQSPRIQSPRTMSPGAGNFISAACEQYIISDPADCEFVTEEDLDDESRNPFAHDDKSGEKSPRSAAKDGLDTALAGLKDKELQDLIHRARRRWKDLSKEVTASREDYGRLELDIEASDREFRECSREIKELFKANKAMMEDLKTRGKREAEVEELKHCTDQKQQELNGLQQRMATLQAGLPSSGSSGSWRGSFFSTASSDSGGAEGGGRGRCIRPGGGGCSLM